MRVFGARLTKGLVALGLLALLFSLVDWRQALGLMRRADGALLLVTALLYPCGLWLCAGKWHLLLLSQGLDLPCPRLFRFYWAGAFAGNFLPSNIGGDLVRLAALRSTGRLAGAAASILMERLTGVAVLLPVSLAALLSRPTYVAGYGLPVLLWALVAGGTGFLATGWFWGAGLARRLEALSPGEEDFWGRVAAKIRKLILALLLYRRQGPALLCCFGLSLLFFALSVVGHGLVFGALGVTVPLLEILLIIPLISFVSMLPVSLGALGLTEGAFVLFFSRAGIAPEQALAAALLCRVLKILVTSVGGLFWWGEKARWPQAGQGP